jgi:hypothetical protein
LRSGGLKQISCRSIARENNQTTIPRFIREFLVAYSGDALENAAPVQARLAQATPKLLPIRCDFTALPAEFMFIPVAASQGGTHKWLTTKANSN